MLSVTRLELRGAVRIRVGKRSWVLLSAVLAAAGVMLGGGSVGSATGPPVGFVKATGSILTLNGQPYRFTGINIYNAANATGCWYSMAGGSTLADSLNAISGTGGPMVMRAWFFQGLATTGGARDWSSFDHALAVAAAHGTRVIVTLGNQWPDCDGVDGGPGDTRTTPGTQRVQASRTRFRETVSYRDWVAEIVARYKNDPDHPRVAASQRSRGQAGPRRRAAAARTRPHF